jgi:hypothetical protein
MLRLFARKTERVSHEFPHNRSNQLLTDFWMIEGPRSFRESIIGDKIDRTELIHDIQRYWL